MAISIANHLDSIQANSRRLNELGDEATNSIRSLQEFLSRLGLGIEVWQYCRPEQDDCHTWIGFARRRKGNSKAWQLLFVDNASAEQPDGRISAMESLPRDKRLLALTYMGSLIERIAERSAEAVDDAVAAVETSASVLRDLEQSLTGLGGQTNGDNEQDEFIVDEEEWQEDEEDGQDLAAHINAAKREAKNAAREARQEARRAVRELRRGRRR